MTKYLLIAVAVLTVLLGAATKWAFYERDAKHEAVMALASQKVETQKAVKQTLELRLEHQTQLRSMEIQLKERQRDLTQLRKETRRVQDSEGSLRKALDREPERTGRVATYLFARGLRDISKYSGSSPEDRKITLPQSTPPRPGSASRNNVEAAPGLGGGENPGGKPPVHPLSRLDRPPGVP
jgi:TolA-binding protein